MDFQVKLGLPPNEKSAAPVLTNIVVNRLDSTIPNMAFSLSGRYEDAVGDTGPRGGGQGDRGPGMPTRDEDRDGDLFGDGRRKTLEQKYRVRSRRSLMMREMEFDMVHIVTKSKIEKKNSRFWWWSVSMELACFWEDDQAPVGPAVMNNIHKNMSEAFLDDRRPILRQLKRALQKSDIRLLSWENELPTDEEDLLYSPVDDGFNETSSDMGDDDDDENSTRNQPGFAQREPLDAGEWDWQTYVGFSVSTFMICFTVILVVLAARRKRLREKSLNWGNLGSQEGVEELLATGWAIKGSQMELYDKQNLGYKDDDSIFLGGFEQKEAVVGTEITITQPESTTTKDLAEFQSSQNASGFSETSGSKPPPASK